MDRRIKRVDITPEFLVQMLKGGTFTIEANPLPEDAQLIGGGVCNFDFDHKKGLIVLMVESKEYDPVPVGMTVDQAPLTVFRNYGHSHKPQAHPMFRRYTFPVEHHRDHGPQGGPTHDCDGEEHEIVEPGDDPSRAE